MHNPHTELDMEFERAHQARRNGNEGQARVCVRRAAGIAIRDFFARHEIHPSSRSAYDLLIQLKEETPLPPDLKLVANHLTLRVTEEVGITTSRDILQAVARGEGPERLLVTLGYAGWGPGQLEQELGENAWLSTPADLDILFHKPSEQRWGAAAALLGIDLNLLSANAGHA